MQHTARRRYVTYAAVLKGAFNTGAIHNISTEVISEAADKTVFVT